MKEGHEVFETSIRSLPLVGRGKVRDIYAVGDDKLLIVTTDRRFLTPFQETFERLWTKLDPSR